ncbi:unnamed protein product [Sympodiomycopsis kandeliae]
MASSGNDNAARKAAGVVQEHLGLGGQGGNAADKAVGQEAAHKTEDTSGFVSTGEAQEAVEKAKQAGGQK